MGSGLRAKVETNLKCKDNEEWYRKKKFYGTQMQVCEDAYNFFEKAFKVLIDIGYLPKSFFELQEDDFGLRLAVKGSFKWHFGKETPYKDFAQYFNTPGYKEWFVHCRNYIRQQMNHYASEYFAATILYWYLNDWTVNEDDLWSSIESLAAKAKKAWEASKGWIEKRNNYIMDTGMRR